MEEVNIARKRIRLLFTVVDRGVGKKVIATCNGVCHTFHLSFMGHGTARSEILDYLGLGETEKDIIMSVVPEDCVEDVLAALQKELRLNVPGNGIAFTIKITSVGGPVTLKFLSGAYEEAMKAAVQRESEAK